MSLQLIAPDGSSLNLFPETRINLELKSSAFSVDFLSGSFSYSFQIPLDDHNRLQLGFPEQISRVARYEKELPYLLKSGMVSVPGVLKIKTINAGFKSASAAFFSTSGALASTLNKTKLYDVPMDTVVLPVPFSPYVHAYLAPIADGPSEGDLIGASLAYLTIPDVPNNSISFFVKWRTDGPTTISDLVESINNPVFPRLYNPTIEYLDHQVVFDEDGNYWEAFGDLPPGTPLVDESVGGDWIFIGSKSAWQSYWFSTYTTKWMYADVNNDGRIKAVATEGEIPFNNSFKVWDIRISQPDIIDVALSFANIGPTYLFDKYDSSVDPDEFKTQYAELITNHLKSLTEISPTDPEATHIFPCIWNDQFISHPDFQGVVNYYAEDNYAVNDVADGQNYRYAISAQLYISYVFKKLFYYLGLSWNTNFFENISHASKILYSNKILRQASSRYYEVGGLKSYDAYPNIYSLQDSTPEATLAQFINGVRSLLFWGIFFDFKSNSVLIKTLNEVIESQPIDWTDIAEPMPEIKTDMADGFYASYTIDRTDALIAETVIPDLLQPGKNKIGTPTPYFFTLPSNQAFGTYVLVTDEDKFYQYIPGNIGDFGWNLKSYNMVGFATGLGEYRYVCQADTLLTFSREKVEGILWTLPSTQQPAYNPLILDSERSGIRILNYLGMQPDSTNALYPMASNSIFNHSNGPTECLTAPRLETDSSCRNRSGNKWIEFLNETYETSWKVPINAIRFAELDFSRPVRIGNHLFIIKSITLPFPLESGLATAILCPVKNVSVAAEPTVILPENRIKFSGEIMDQAALEAAFGFAISNYTVIGTNVYFDATPDQELTGDSFANNESIEEVELPCLKTVKGFGFCTGLRLVRLANAILCGNKTFRNTAIQEIYMPVCVNLGASSDDDGVFQAADVSGLTITVPLYLQTAFTGSPDGDLQFVTDNGGSVVYV